jgi:CMP-N,N'-diacetyllegionaminic acid synthase
MFGDYKNFFGFVGARQGSKGLPGKNKLNINGQPLFLIALNNLRAVGLTQIIFSSDCDDMLQIARDHGYTTEKRPEKFSNDSSRIPEEILRLSIEYNITCEYVLSVPPTAPLLRTQSLISAIKKVMASGNIDSCIAVNDWHSSYPGLAFYKDQNNQLTNIGNKLGIETYPRQDRIKLFENTGAFYIRNLKKMKAGKLDKSTNWLGKKILFQEITQQEAINIDIKADWERVKKYIKK